MNDESGSVPAVNDDKDISINEMCSEKEIKAKDRVATIGGGRGGIMGTNAMRSFIPMLAMATMMMEPMGHNPYAGLGSRMSEPLRERKCALPECDVHFTPAIRSEICCSKEHFIILRDTQKLKAKIHQPKKKKKNKRKRKKK